MIQPNVIKRVNVELSNCCMEHTNLNHVNVVRLSHFKDK